MKYSRTRVYVSGPDSSDPANNTERAIAVGQTLLDMGYAPFVPHLSHFWDLRHENDYSVWLDLDLAYVATCKAVLLMSGHSPGAEREVEAADALGVPVFRNTSDLFNAIPIFSTVESTKDDEPTAPAPVEQALEHIRSIFAKKNADYSDGRSWDSNFRDVAAQMGSPRPQEAVETLIAVKQARLRSLRVRGSEPQNEAVEDTVLDRAVYSVIRLALDIESTNTQENQ